MTIQTMHGGLFDGRIIDVADDTSRVVFPTTCATSTGGIGRSLAELEPEIRVDYDTGAIASPPELVLGFRNIYYRRTADGFVCEEGE